MTEATHVVQVLPGGEKVLWGGTRKGVKLSRPVEAGVLFDPTKTKCPYHNPNEKSLAEFFDGEIRVLGNPMTPHREGHRLVIPRECTSEAEVRALGGRELLVQCLHVVGVLASEAMEELALGVHVLRGQNVPHLHWHVYGYHPEEKLDRAREFEWAQPEIDECLVVLRSTNFQVVARGVKVGQLMLVPSAGEPLPLLDRSAEVAWLLSDLVKLTNRAFTSTQGEMPHYTVSGRLSARAKLRYLLYTPDLQNIGCSDDLADLNGTARARPWSPFETVEHLKKVLAG